MYIVPQILRLILAAAGSATFLPVSAKAQSDDDSWMLIDEIHYSFESESNGMCKFGAVIFSDHDLAARR